MTILGKDYQNFEVINLHCKTAGKPFRWKFTCGGRRNSPQVTIAGGNLLALAGNLHNVFFVRVRADFIKPRDVSSSPVANILTKVTTS